MKKRNVVSDPQPEDVLVRDGHRIEVTRREGETIHYVAWNSPTDSRALFQSLTGWRRWAGGFKVKHRGQDPRECTVVRTGIAGRCLRCCNWMDLDVHVFEDPQLGLGLFCGETCCGAVSHYKTKENKDGRDKEAAAA